MDRNELARDLLDRIRRQIPLTAAMGLARLEIHDDRLVLAMPLGPNSNDKGTGFAGSLYSLCVLASWALVTETLEEAGIRVPVVVASSNTDFRRPIMIGEIVAVARLAGGATRETLVSEFREKGTIKPAVEAVVEEGGKMFCRFGATFVARR
ncbi:MAG: putative thioesterase (yiiD_Cterm) [Planctomycetes bacterium ADurb.Bin126]|nr:MAG: putative thioesterase (yiiD_Cterm) [Planctomycetes bacterium ADurb.Bin126]HOD83896.1 YiiD C-terminal domain-containing protein [Phycisphaerae bacterium]HQL75491.1 YiiD C-terminal domain-containing protein [Phycisphaerae bacterium]